MALSITHAFVCPIADDPTALVAGEITPSRYNAEHTVVISASDIGAEPANANIQMHISTTGNPHGTTAADIGADATGTAAAAVSGHLSAFTHSDIAHSNRTALDAYTGPVDITGKANLTRIRHVFWPAGAAIPQSATAPAAATTDSGTNDVFFDTYGFDSDTTEWVQFVGELEHWNASSIKCKAVWTYTGSPSGTIVEWGFSARSFGDDDALNQAFDAATVVSDTMIAALDNHVTDATAGFTPAGTPVNGERLQLKVSRTGNIANKMAGDALLIGVMIEYTEASTEEVVW